MTDKNETAYQVFARSITAGVPEKAEALTAQFIREVWHSSSPTAFHDLSLGTTGYGAGAGAGAMATPSQDRY